MQEPSLAPSGAVAIVGLPARDRSKASWKHTRTSDPKARSKKKKKTEAETLPQVVEPIFEDRAASANLFGACTGALLSPPRFCWSPSYMPIGRRTF